MGSSLERVISPDPVHVMAQNRQDPPAQLPTVAWVAANKYRGAKPTSAPIAIDRRRARFTSATISHGNASTHPARSRSVRPRVLFVLVGGSPHPAASNDAITEIAISETTKDSATAPAQTAQRRHVDDRRTCPDGPYCESSDGGGAASTSASSPVGRRYALAAAFSSGGSLSQSGAAEPPAHAAAGARGGEGERRWRPGSSRQGLAN